MVAASLPALASPISIPFLALRFAPVACVERIRNRSPSTKKCVCQVLPRFLSAIGSSPFLPCCLLLLLLSPPCDAMGFPMGN